LDGVYFKGNAPTLNAAGKGDFGTNTTIYYLPGTTGWNATYGNRPTALWNPKAQTSSPNFGVRTNRFGFTIIGTPNIPLVIETSSNLNNFNWITLQSCTLTNGSFYFSAPQWTNHPNRFYRIRSP
jgi:hypothetical protein